MPYTLEWSSDRRLVKVRHSGHVTIDEIQDSLNDLEGAIDLSNRPCILVDVRATTSYPAIADVLFVSEKNTRRPRVSERVAFIFNERTAETIEFMILAASNRGFRVAAFAGEDAAIDWLFGTSQAP